MELAAFAGVWQRQQLLEPQNAPEPHAHSAAPVFWLQSRGGAFVDIRQLSPTPDSCSAATFKSFAGVGNVATLESSGECHFSWKRLLDYRPMGPPDVGSMRWLEPSLLQEDGLLPADDYREIWRRVSPADAPALGALLHQSGDVGSIGVAVAMSGYAAFATQLSRPAAPKCVTSFFSETAQRSEPIGSEIASWLERYFCAVAKDGVIFACSRHALIGQPMALATAEFLTAWCISSPCDLSSTELEQLNAALGVRLSL
jgi:hypothetical protein